MLQSDLTALWLTIKLAFITAILLLAFCIPVAYKLAGYKGKFKPFLEALIAMPLVLPPTLLGFYLLVLFSPTHAVGQFWFWLTGTQLAFSFQGVVIGSLFYSLPFVMQPLVAGFKQINQTYNEAAIALGLSHFKRFVYLILPLLKPSIGSAFALGFAHTLGEFGLVLMIGGNIQGETQVVSIALYDHVESLNYAAAHQLSLILLAISFACLVLLFKFNKSIVGVKQ
ncbi:MULTISPECIES: molybdate ABC transporter permease subunit [unclassified Pseudoalteromonas]|uniref:molybdate ABC transporter permease subunit n=1 Tax=unclassified Pseudoalteromonas TaxID=194690 RepID=UPI000731A260|nr:MULTISPECIES: molybdate ABC transporter permease subunit [unclassified Pseudoalteromonas]KTD90199.1 molybdenum ABC transporter permease [Pseudoalteromonas sp. H71]TMN81287.1 molybdate ABC transporter permease subunit [Pseudoalteromonas sp. S410]TMN89268.1 molybdate ABC transporter permease subunit [Pseudoalteromonas sp. S408]TMN95046.1 molybdate ABC transporter permease subunit [Pseudoalteromonas sp. S407]TMO00656.1 molybdate ABC transporter permease subunit [Pseudoalteromonas sp. S409]